MSETLDQEVARHIAEPYWPWPLAFAYTLPIDVRHRVVAAAVEVLSTYSGLGAGEFAASSAVARAYEVTTGRKYKGHPVEQTVRDGEPDTVKAAEAVYWEEIAELEGPLVGAIRCGKLKSWGRDSPDAALHEIDAADWVGSEVDGGQTCDLLREGWRASDLLGQALGESKRSVLAFDIHLLGAAVCKFVEDLDAQRSAKVTDDLLAGDYAAFEDCEAEASQVREGYWSPLAAGAWIASRSNSFVAAVQLWEDQRHVELGGPHSASAWLVVGNVMGQRFEMTLTAALDRLKEKLLSGQIESGTGFDLQSGKPRPIELHEWRAWEGGAHEYRGVFLLPGIYDCAWQSASIRAAFPCSDRANGQPVSVSLVPPGRTAVELDKLKLDWAEAAALNGVTITDARTNAVAALGEEHAPKEIECRELLRAAKSRIGRPVRLGRPKGSKSFAKRA